MTYLASLPFAIFAWEFDYPVLREYWSHLVAFYSDMDKLNNSADAFLLVIGVLLGIGASAITFRIPFKELFWATAAGFLGWETMYCLSQFQVATLPATTLGAFTVSITAEILARDRRAPATIYVVPGILPLVPGRAIYNTMLNSLNGDYALSSSGGTQALFGAGGIAIGMLLGTAIARGLMHPLHRSRAALERELQRHPQSQVHILSQEHREKFKKRRKDVQRSIRDISQNVEERFARFLDNVENTNPTSANLKRTKALYRKMKLPNSKSGGKHEQD